MGQRCVYMNWERESSEQGHRHGGEGTPSLERQKEEKCDTVFGQEKNLSRPGTGERGLQREPVSTLQTALGAEG